jgi:aminotransferase
MRANLRRISRRVCRVPWSGVRKMFDLAQKFENAINLSVGEPDFPTPSHVIEASFRAVKAGYTHYTPNAGLMEFREAAAEKLKKENEIEVDPAGEIIATTGAMGALSIAVLTIINPGDEVLIPNPGFVSYAAQVALAEGKPIYYPTLIEGRFDIDLEKLENLISQKTKAILINSPSNPTGMVLGDKVLKRVAEIALENDLLVISDEAYEAIVYDGAKHVSIASLSEMKDRTISIFTLSKTHAMTGWRIGFATANEEIIKHMTKLQEHLCAHPSSISQMAAVAALRGPKDHIKMMVKEYTERRELVVKELNSIPGIKCPKPQGAFYVFPNIDAFKKSSQDFAMEILEKAKVIVVPGLAFGSKGEGHIRISYAVSKNKIKEAMLRIKGVIETLN